MVNALILLVFIEFLANEGTAIRCEFPSPDMTEAPIRVLLEPSPSLKDQPGLYRVMMRMDNGTALKALAQPITGTEDRDVMIRVRQGERAMFTIGLRDDGAAAFNIQKRVRSDDSVLKQTRTGACRGHEMHINRWLP